MDHSKSHFQPRLTRLFLILSQGCHQFSYHFILKFTIFSTKKFVLIVLLIHKFPRFKIRCISSFWQNCKDLGCLKNCLVSITLLVFFLGYIHQKTDLSHRILSIKWCFSYEIDIPRKNTNIVFLRNLIFLEKSPTLLQQQFQQDDEMTQQKSSVVS